MDASAGGGTTSAHDELHEKIMNQVEFYFSDANLPSDKFMLKHTGKAGTDPGCQSTLFCEITVFYPL